MISPALNLELKINLMGLLKLQIKNKELIIEKYKQHSSNMKDKVS
jgi:hypothetical protein